MQKSKVIVLTAAFVLGLCPLVYAKYLGGFKVVNVTKDEVTIQKGMEKPIKVPANVKKYHVGDKVKYDAKTGKLLKERRRLLEGC